MDGNSARERVVSPEPTDQVMASCLVSRTGCHRVIYLRSPKTETENTIEEKERGILFGAELEAISGLERSHTS